MKKIMLSLVTSFALMQSVQAIPSNLGESLIEYSAIIDSSLLQSTIPQSEFIIDIKRKTKSLTATTVIYEVVTRVSGNSEIEALMTHCSHSSHHDGGQRSQINKYSVQLVFTPNPQVGPPIITVVSVEPISSHSTMFFGAE